MDLHLRGKRVLITGASKGIGAAAAEAFAEEGANLLLAARNGDQLKALAERLRSAHQIDAAISVVDLRKPEDLARLAKEAADIDILVNNAGDIPGGSIDKIDEATWRHAWELKVFGYINLTRAVYARMKARGGGVIVNDIGAAGEKFDANYICGSAGNAALMSFTRALGGKSLADNIRVVGINPGPVGTDRHVTLLKTRAKDPDVWYQVAEVRGLSGNTIGLHQARAEFFALVGDYNQAIEQLDFAKRRASNNFQLASRIDARQRELAEEKRLVEQMLR